MTKKYNRLDPQVLLVKERRVLTIEYIVGNKVFEHQIGREDRYVMPERSMHWNNWPAKYLDGKISVPSKNELKQIALEGGAE